MKVNDVSEKLVLELRATRKLGARRIQSELKRQNNISLAVATIHKILCKHGVKSLPTYKRRVSFTRYQRPIPGERVQMETSAQFIMQGLMEHKR